MEVLAQVAGDPRNERMLTRDREISFPSFFWGGFECSTHRLRSGRRLDLVASTEHDRWLRRDYERLVDQGIRVAREGLRWHVIEREPGLYDWSSVLAFLEAARACGILIAWDLLHFGWPEDLDVFRPEFRSRFTRFARAFAELLRSQDVQEPWICPINEISFLAWAAGDRAYMQPFAHARGMELKVQLVASALAASDAVLEVLPGARFIVVDPINHIVADPARPEDLEPARQYDMAQFEAWDMLVGRVWPQIGGEERYLDVMGVNYYSNNQWIYGQEGRSLHRTHPLYWPLRQLLARAYERYRRPLVITETGIENEARPEWLAYVCNEVEAAQRSGVPVLGICLYPVINHPGWDNDRHCYNGLWDYPQPNGDRVLYQPLADQLKRERARFGSGQP